MKALLAGLKDAAGVLALGAVMLGVWWIIEAFARAVERAQ
jgi:hypothetical protein